MTSQAGLSVHHPKACLYDTGNTRQLIVTVLAALPQDFSCHVQEPALMQTFHRFCISPQNS